MSLGLNKFLTTFLFSLSFHLLILYFYSLIPHRKTIIKETSFDQYILNRLEKIKSTPITKNTQIKTSATHPSDSKDDMSTSPESINTPMTNLGNNSITNHSETKIVSIPSYPVISKRLGEEGIVEVYVNCIDICSFQVTKTSGYDRLDQTIIDYMKKVDLKDFSNKNLIFKFKLK